MTTIRVTVRIATRAQAAQGKHQPLSAGGVGHAGRCAPPHVTRLRKPRPLPDHPSQTECVAGMGRSPLAARVFGPGRGAARWPWPMAVVPSRRRCARCQQTSASWRTTCLRALRAPTPTSPQSARSCGASPVRHCPLSERQSGGIPPQSSSPSGQSAHPPRRTAGTERSPRQGTPFRS